MGIRWWLTLAWAATGLLLALAFTAVGPFAAPIGAVIAVVLALKTGLDREATWVVTGAGALFIWGGTANVGATKCPKGPVYGDQFPNGCSGTSGPDYLWLGIGVVLLAVPIIITLVESQNRRRGGSA